MNGKKKYERETHYTLDFNKRWFDNIFLLFLLSEKRLVAVRCNFRFFYFIWSLRVCACVCVTCECEYQCRRKSQVSSACEFLSIRFIHANVCPDFFLLRVERTTFANFLLCTCSVFTCHFGDWHSVTCHQHNFVCLTLVSCVICVCGGSAANFVIEFNNRELDVVHLLVDDGTTKQMIQHQWTTHECVEHHRLDNIPITFCHKPQTRTIAVAGVNLSKLTWIQSLTHGRHRHTHTPRLVGVERHPSTEILVFIWMNENECESQQSTAIKCHECVSSINCETSRRRPNGVCGVCDYTTICSTKINFLSVCVWLFDNNKEFLWFVIVHRFCFRFNVFPFCCVVIPLHSLEQIETIVLYLDKRRYNLNFFFLSFPLCLWVKTDTHKQTQIGWVLLFKCILFNSPTETQRHFVVETKYKKKD